MAQGFTGEYAQTARCQGTKHISGTLYSLAWDDSDDYSGILKLLFNAEAKQRLKVVNLKSSKGELVLRVGDSEPFGLINIGDDAGFFKEAEKPGNLVIFDTRSGRFRKLSVLDTEQ